MKIIVFGGSGFLGSHLSEELLIRGHEVAIFDLNPYEKMPKEMRFIQGDILDCEHVIRCVKGYDCVYNFAAISDLNKAINQPLRSAQVNIIGNINILEACRVNDIQRYIYASSVYAYSSSGSFYSCTKTASELYINEYNKEYGLNFTILRFGSLYGPRSGPENGLWRIVNDALKNNQVSYIGNQDSVREYIHVYDAAVASCEILDDKYQNEVIVLTGLEKMKVYDMLSILSEILGLGKKIKFENREYKGHYVMTPYSFTRNIAKKYVPKNHIEFGQGLLNLIEYINEKRN
ncbi:NAD(P)-dependent oxidoreductase [Schleiferiaceae bacterium]|nr:NAD(P)-dependent oxidoreductase [Schleiferiaceae bacterium]